MLYERHAGVALLAQVSGKLGGSLHGCHAIGDVYEQVHSLACALFHKQYCPLALLLQVEGLLAQFLCSALVLVYVHHYASQRLQHAGPGAAVALEQRAVGCPEGQFLLFLFLFLAVVWQ